MMHIWIPTATLCISTDSCSIWCETKSLITLTTSLQNQVNLHLWH